MSSEIGVGRPMYRCSSCGLAVIVLPDHEPIRACLCDGTIVCELQANLAGMSDVGVR